MSMHPDHDAPAKDWMAAGLAIPTEKGKHANFEGMSFVEAQANQLLFLTGKGALTLDREAKRRPPPQPH